MKLRHTLMPLWAVIATLLAESVKNGSLVQTSDSKYKIVIDGKEFALRDILGFLGIPLKQGSRIMYSEASVWERLIAIGWPVVCQESTSQGGIDMVAKIAEINAKNVALAALVADGGSVAVGKATLQADNANWLESASKAALQNQAGTVK